MLLGYSRVSTEDQAKSDRTSLTEQQRVIRGLAMTRGVESYDIAMFVDPGVSGSVPLLQRPDGAKMLAAAKAGDIIVAVKLDRLFRSAPDALMMAEEFRERGIDLILIDMGMDPVTSNGTAKLFFGMLAVFAEFERERIGERMAAGRKGKRERGGHLGGSAPYGFQVVGEGRDAKLEPVETEQEIIGRIKRWSRDNKLGVVIKKLHSNNVLTRTGKPFEFEQVKRILRRQENAH